VALLTALFGTRRDEARLAHALRTVPLFRDVPADDLVAVWRCLQEVRAPAGSVICEMGAPGDTMYVVQAGEIEVRLGLGDDGVRIRRGGPGDFVGEMALLTGEPRSADVVVVADAVLWALERHDFDALLDRSTSLARALNRGLAERVALMTRLVAKITPATLGGMVGLRFGPFRVVEQLGAGGMAVVYAAVHETTKASAALKVLPSAWGAAPELRARLSREADALRRVDHLNVVRVLDVGDVDPALGGGCYIALEWLPQGLDRVLRAQFPEPLAPPVALRIARSVADALDATHRAGLLHRDVKPSNVMLRADATPVLTDFGLATLLSEQALAARLTPSNVVVGTADYMAPEQIDGGPPDPRTDIYALGVVLYEMLAGHVPFAGREPMATLDAHRRDPPPRLPEAVPAAARAIVERALRKQPAERFGSAAEMGEAIGAAEAALRPE
jgi:CRP-like cAMP-binding protein